MLAANPGPGVERTITRLGTRLATERNEVTPPLVLCEPHTGTVDALGNANETITFTFSGGWKAAGSFSFDPDSAHVVHVSYQMRWIWCGGSDAAS